MKTSRVIFFGLMILLVSSGLSGCGGSGGAQAASDPGGSAPTVPTGVAAVAKDSQVTISWNSVTTAISYNIYWSTTSGVTPANGTKISGANSPYTQTGLSDGTTYYYIVTAVNSYGESQPSSQVSATPKTPTYAFTVLHSFSGADGANPKAGLVMDSTGNLYGTTGGGGANNDGTVFKLDTSGNETVLYSFSGGADGKGPAGGLVMDSAGNLYGTTVFGGYGDGTVFKLDTSGNETVLYSFSLTDGVYPDAGLVMDSVGSLYGTTESGGANSNSEGTVFKLDTSGNETVLHSFNGSLISGDGYSPEAGLVMDSAGNLFGTTDQGGANGFGAVFKLDPSGNETVLHSFTFDDGMGSEAKLVMDSAGNLYGTTVEGGANDNGTVFKLDPSGNETVFYSFGTGKDGYSPEAGLVMDSAGNLYGTTYFGGAFYNATDPYDYPGYGTVFKFDPSGNETVLHSFTGADGGYPWAGLVMDSAGNLYGTTYNGGSSGYGTVFKLSPQY